VADAKCLKELEAENGNGKTKTEIYFPPYLAALASWKPKQKNKSQRRDPLLLLLNGEWI